MVIFHVKPGMSYAISCRLYKASRDTACVCIGDSIAVYVSGDWYRNILWLAVHSCYLPLVYHISFVMSTLVFAFPHVRLAGSDKVLTKF